MTCFLLSTSLTGLQWLRDVILVTSVFAFAKPFGRQMFSLHCLMKKKKGEKKTKIENTTARLVAFSRQKNIHFVENELFSLRFGHLFHKRFIIKQENKTQEPNPHI